MEIILDGDHTRWRSSRRTAFNLEQYGLGLATVMEEKNPAEFPETNYQLIRELAENDTDRSSELLGEFLLQYQQPLLHYLASMGVSEIDREDAVSDFMYRCLKSPNLFKLPPNRTNFRNRLRTSLLNHYLDNYRKKQRDIKNRKKLQEEAAYRVPDRPAHNDPLEFGWAYSVLELGIETYRESKMGQEEPDREKVRRQMTDWEIFLRRYIGCPREDLQPITYTLDEIAEQLELPKSGMKDRCARIRREFRNHLKQALLDTVDEGTFEERWNDFQFCLLLGNTQRVDLSRMFPELEPEAPIESLTEFSLTSLIQLDSWILEELVVDTEHPLTDDHFRHLWSRVLMSRVYSGESISSVGSSSELDSSLQDLLTSDNLALEDVLRLKELSKRRGNDSGSPMRKLHHALYVLMISVARNRFDEVVSTLEPEKIVATMQHALRYEWLDDLTLKEIEGAIRQFLNDENPSSDSESPPTAVV